MALQIIAVLVLGLMCGSELNVAVFGHPTLKRQPLETHILVRSSFAALFGRVMPFWMPSSTLLNLVLLLPFEHLNETAWRLTAISLAIQVLAVLFSLVVAPYPSTTGSQNGHRKPFLTTGQYWSIAGIHITGSERAD